MPQWEKHLDNGEELTRLFRDAIESLDRRIAREKQLAEAEKILRKPIISRRRANREPEGIL